jgi:hypothetical protein
MKKILVVDNNEKRGMEIRNNLSRVLFTFSIKYEKGISEMDYANFNYEAVFFHHNNVESDFIVSALIEKKICGKSFNSPPIVAFSGGAFNFKQKREGYYLYRADYLEEIENIEFILSGIGIIDG